MPTPPASLKKLFPFQSRFIELDGHRIHYVDEGSGPAILMMHACPMWSFEFRNLISLLSSTHRVVAFDQLGFGLSDKPSDFDYRLETHTDQLGRLTSALDIDAFTLLMHGRGSTIGTAYAVRHPDSVKGIITFNTMTFSDYRLPFRLVPCRFGWHSWAHIAMRFKVFQRDTDRLPKDIRQCYEYPFPDEKSRIAVIRFIEDMPCTPEDDSSLTMFEIESGLFLLREKPVCIIWAKKDWLYKTGYFKRWREYFPNAETHFAERAGRCITEDAADELADIIPNFLEKHNL